MMKREFPDFFPENFMDAILELGAKEQELSVYRVCRNGTINRDSFECTYKQNNIQDKDRCDKPVVLNRDLYRSQKIKFLGQYSTSCFKELKDIKRILNSMAKSTPQQIVAKGVTTPECGPCLESSSNSHVHWWLYKNSHPENSFTKITVEEE